MGRDVQGINRGKCSKPDCDCTQYLYKKEKGPKCSNCGHVPVIHTEIGEAVIEPSNNPSGFTPKEAFKKTDERNDKETFEYDGNGVSRSDGSSIDIRGTLRGRCSTPRCDCRQFSYIKTQGPKCNVCGHAPGQHTQLTPTSASPHSFIQEEVEKDAAPLFKKSQIKIPNWPLGSDLTISDMEDPMNSSSTVSVPIVKPRKKPPIDSTKQMPTVSHSLGTHPTTIPKSGVPTKKKPQKDRLGNPAHPMDGHQPSSVLPVQTDPASQMFLVNPPKDGYILQQQQKQQPSNIPPPAPAAANVLTTPQPSVQQPSGQQTCKFPGCGSLVYVEASGRVHEFCSLKHASAFNSNNAGGTGVPPNLKCSNPSCGRIKYQENGTYFDYCGKSCRDSYRNSQQQGLQVPPATGNPSQLPGNSKHNNNTSQSDLKSDSQSDLKKPRSGLKDWLFSKLGKSKPVPEDSPNTQCSNCQKKNATIQFYEVAFCSQKCKDEAMQKYQAEHELESKPKVSPENACLLPGCNNPKYYDTTRKYCSDYCGQTHANEAKKNLIKKASKQEFQRIQAHFTQWWDSRKGPCGQLHQVFVIDNPKLKYQFQKYHSSLSVKTIGQYYHGTGLKCAIYQNATVCSDNSCGICGVSQKGMLPNFKTSNITFQRFGNGFYLAPNSSKCHDYTRGYDKYRAMLLFDVAEGNKYIVKNDQTTLTAPPQGYDSVYGQHGSSLNYDEIVLYKSEAILPTHVVVYIKDGIHKIAK